jgi:4-hydroxybenzoate polyprenyltransferase
MFPFLLTMNKLKKISLIFISSTFVIALFALVTLNALFIVSGVASFVMALYYLYLQRARQSFKKDFLDAMK